VLQTSPAFTVENSSCGKHTLPFISIIHMLLSYAAF